MMTLAMMLHMPAGWADDTPLEHRHLILAYAAVLLIQAGYAGWVLLQRARLRTRK